MIERERTRHCSSASPRTVADIYIAASRSSQIQRAQRARATTATATEGGNAARSGDAASAVVASACWPASADARRASWWRDARARSRRRGAAAYGSASARLEIALVLNNPLPPCWQADQLSALRDIWRSPLVHAKSTSQYPRSLLARAGTWKPRQKAGFDFGTCQTRLRSSWHATNPMRGPPGSGVQCEDRYCVCAHA